MSEIRGGVTALMVASRRGNIGAISVLLHAGAAFNIVDGNGHTMLHYQSINQSILFLIKRYIINALSAVQFNTHILV